MRNVIIAGIVFIALALTNKGGTARNFRGTCPRRSRWYTDRDWRAGRASKTITGAV